jgi:hypothetical protein
MRQNSYYRRASAQLREAREIAASMERSERARSADGKEPERIRARLAARAEAFDALQVGDSLELFGVCAVVGKKNRKSVVTTTGTRWTRRGLTGAK